MDKNDTFRNLLENIETTIYEGLLKLGYKDNESFSIYYDLDLLNYLLHEEFTGKEACLSFIQNSLNSPELKSLGINVSLELNRFKITVSKKGIDSIYKNNKDNLFLKELINKVNTHNFNLEDILTVFKRYSDNFICEKIDNAEFQYVIYFTDLQADKFKYCFTFDEMGGYYHRLLDFSYEQIMKEHKEEK